MDHPFAPHDNCRLGRCTQEHDCRQHGHCVSIVDQAYSYNFFLKNDCMPALRHILKQLDDGDAPGARREVQALLTRAARTV